MKGKGKKNRDSSDEESSQCPLMFIDFKPLDHSKICPRYSAVLNRSEEEGIRLEDLDALQIDLETLLVSVIKRQTQLENEMESLANWQDKPKDKKTSSEISGKRSKATEDRPNKKFKESPTNSSSSSSSKSHSIKPKSKNLKIQEVESKQLPTFLPVVRNDVPDKFWSFVDGYCAPITHENSQILEDLLKNYDDDSEYLKVPNLGKHYTVRWTQEDRWDNQKEDTKSVNDKKKGLSPSNTVSPSDGRKPKGSKDCKNDNEKCAFGALTQRLVSCLIEENLISSPSLGGDCDFDADGTGKNLNGDKSQLFKNVHFGNTTQLEKRIKTKLEEHGFLDADDVSGNEPLTTSNNEDEVLNELTRCQNELKTLQTVNQSRLKQLLIIAKHEISKYELKKKLDAAESEVIDAYRRILSAKQKKRTPSKKEKEMAAKALKERDAILKQMKDASLNLI